MQKRNHTIIIVIGSIKMYETVRSAMIQGFKIELCYRNSLNVIHGYFSGVYISTFWYNVFVVFGLKSLYSSCGKALLTIIAQKNIMTNSSILGRVIKSK